MKPTQRWQSIYLALAAGLCWALVLSGPFPSHAAQAGEKLLDLDRAVEMALSYSPSLRAVLEDRMAARALQDEAFTGFLPSLSTSYTWQHADEAPVADTSSGVFQTGTQDTYQWSTSLIQPIFTGFRVSTQYRLAELGVDLAEISVRLARLQVAFKVKDAYFKYLQAIKTQEVAVKSMELLHSQLKTSTDFFDVGILPKNDVLKVKVELANAQQSLVEAENNLANTQARLNSLLGLPVESRLLVKDILEHNPWKISFAQAMKTAILHRPELKVAELQIAQAEESITLAKSGYWPEVSLTGEYIMTSDVFNLENSSYHDISSWQLTTNLTWTFWEWGRTTHQVSRSKAAKRKQMALKDDLMDQVELEVKQAISFLRDSEKNIATARTQVEQATENYRITNERYKEQLTTNTELLDAQTLLTQARNNYFRSLTVFNIAKAGLLRAMGQGAPQAKNAKPDLEPAR